MRENRFTHHAIGIGEYSPTAYPNPLHRGLARIDTLLLCVLAFIGLVGSLYVFCCFRHPDKAEMAHQYDTMHAQRQVTTVWADPFAQHMHVSVSGSYEAHQPINFQIDGYNPQVRYVVNLGNGEEFFLDSDRFNYRYPRVGQYTVRMRALFKNQTRVLLEKQLNITPEDHAVFVAKTAAHASI